MSIIPGNFHPYPTGARLWECTVCGAMFVWGPKSSRWGNVEYAAAVFCRDECAGKWTPPKRMPKIVALPIGHIAKERAYFEPAPSWIPPELRKAPTPSPQ